MRNLKKYLIAALVLSSGFINQNSPADELSPANSNSLHQVNGATLGEALTNVDLADLSGRQEVQINKLDVQQVNSDQRGQLANNGIFNTMITNGANSISDNAFAQASGLVTVIQNSGNQVLIQNDLIMNLTVK